jgi:hypothetical protein
MTVTDDLEAVVYFVGDTSAIGFVVRDPAGDPVDVTGYSFRLTVSRARHPSSAGDQIASFAATVLDGPAGRIGFTPLATSWSTAPAQDFHRGIASYWYDVEQVDAVADVHTYGTGRFLLKRGISS